MGYGIKTKQVPKKKGQDHGYGGKTNQVVRSRDWALLPSDMPRLWGFLGELTFLCLLNHIASYVSFLLV